MIDLIHVWLAFPANQVRLDGPSCFLSCDLWTHPADDVTDVCHEFRIIPGCQPVAIGRLQDGAGWEVVFLECCPTIGEMFSRYQAHAVGKSKLNLPEIVHRSNDRFFDRGQLSHSLFFIDFFYWTRREMSADILTFSCYDIIQRISCHSEDYYSRLQCMIIDAAVL